MKAAIRNIIEWGILGLAALIYKISGRTPKRGYYALLRLHSLTNGHSTARLARLVSVLGRQDNSINLITGGSLVPPLSREESVGLLDALEQDGYAVYPHRLPAGVCERLTAYCKEIQGVEWYPEGVTENRNTYGDRSQNLGKIQFDAIDLTASPEVQNLMADGTLLQLAQKNLGALPILNSVVAWWSFATTGEASAEIAQMFHHDMESIRWLKVFFYLT